MDVQMNIGIQVAKPPRIQFRQFYCYLLNLYNVIPISIERKYRKHYCPSKLI